MKNVQVTTVKPQTVTPPKVIQIPSNRRFCDFRVCLAISLVLSVAGGLMLALVVKNLGFFAASPTAQVDEATVSHFRTFTRFSSMAAITTIPSVATWDCILCQKPDMQVKKGHVYILDAAKDTFLEHHGIAVVSDTLQSIIVSISGSQSFGAWSQNLDLLLERVPIATVNSQDTQTEENLVNASSTAVPKAFEKLVEYPNGKPSKVHSGFWNVWTLVKPVLVPILKNLTKEFPNYDVTFTGHSLGGAIALLGAADSVYSGLLQGNKTRVITIGQPRVGNAAFRNLVLGMKLKEISRVINYNDPVPHLGMQAWGYNHIENEYYIDSTGGVFVCDDAAHGGEDTNCGNTQLLPLGMSEHMRYLGVRMARDE
ncbi:Alpha/Beta hydrolase protein [Obelidium mucronatum]|nr:Alpha/Beta hydrolase protein [Obelidium mucronatum]